MKTHIFFIILLISCLWGWLAPTKYLAAETTASKIWVITDIHHLSPTLYDNGEYFQHILATAGGMDIIHSSQRLEALIKQIEQEQPDLLLVSGDLTLNGEYQSMLELADVFARIERVGTEVYVIPGNHDISNGWASHFTGETLIRVRQVLPEEFKQIFSDFGYSEAVAIDASSLSYVAKTQENLVLLMIDSNIYTQEEGEGAPVLNGTLNIATKDWLWNYLEESVSESDIVLPIVHHNSLNHFDTVTAGYTLDNAEELHKIFHYYNIPLVLSGHIHAQHISELKLDDLFTLTEIVTGSFAMAPNSIGNLVVDSNGSINYEQLVLDVESWAIATGNPKLSLLNYGEYMENLFLDNVPLLTENTAFKHIIYEEAWTKELNNFYAEVNLAIFTGDFTVIWPELKQQFHHIADAVEKQDNGFFRDYFLTLVEKRSGEHQKLQIN